MPFRLQLLQIQVFGPTFWFIYWSLFASLILVAGWTLFEVVLWIWPYFWIIIRLFYRRKVVVPEIRVPTGLLNTRALGIAENASHWEYEGGQLLHAPL